MPWPSVRILTTAMVPLSSSRGERLLDGIIIIIIIIVSRACMRHSPSAIMFARRQHVFISCFACYAHHCDGLLLVSKCPLSALARLATRMQIRREHLVRSEPHHPRWIKRRRLRLWTWRLAQCRRLARRRGAILNRGRLVRRGGIHVPAGSERPHSFHSFPDTDGQQHRSE